MLPLALGCAKLSFLLFYRRIFVINHWAKTNIFLIGMCTLVVLWMWGFCLTFLFMCRLNFWALWTTARAVLDLCIADSAPNFALTITDVITDIAILAIPVPLVSSL